MALNVYDLFDSILSTAEDLGFDVRDIYPTFNNGSKEYVLILSNPTTGILPILEGGKVYDHFRSLGIKFEDNSDKSFVDVVYSFEFSFSSHCIRNNEIWYDGNIFCVFNIFNNWKNLINRYVFSFQSPIYSGSVLLRKVLENLMDLKRKNIKLLNSQDIKICSNIFKSQLSSLDEYLEREEIFDVDGSFLVFNFSFFFNSDSLFRWLLFNFYEQLLDALR